MPEGYIDVPKALNTARKLVAEYETVMSRIGIVRTDLRNAVELGDATPEQATEIAAMFPKRERKSKGTTAKA